MNHELISQICFAEIYVVPTHQTARSLFTACRMAWPTPTR